MRKTTIRQKIYDNKSLPLTIRLVTVQDPGSTAVRRKIINLRSRPNAKIIFESAKKMISRF